MIADLILERLEKMLARNRRQARLFEKELGRVIEEEHLALASQSKKDDNYPGL